MSSYSKLKQRIQDSGLRLQFIADKLGITRYSLSNKINDVTEFKKSEIVTLCDLLQIGNSEIADYFFAD